MANHHRRESSVPHVQLTQPLPPLPLSDIPPRLSIATQISYRDDPEEEEEELLSAHSARSPSQPPRYEPMYDYLRARQQMTLQVPTCTRPTSNPENASEEPYRDEPFVITIIDSVEEDDVSQPPPPSYNELYRQNNIEMENLMRQFETEDTPAEQTEEICKWVVAMLLVALTIACVGTAFNWGRPSCTWTNRSMGKC
ncbi:uncharacterized protein LY89DRAFT_627803 [Mollisia scopiformis]|uniref:Uncharacterized protein n=1 Tax=Mollisia scopiformis TaxID=149040 RepID=A0A132BBG5_MOLSC|nr:uncharacterized protein LY89DRAFT_627803 [Mollisia scopiformis]KUJ09613.1 hypothetical protein LY89DRAFT_627803 [Mollisia scopiformis]